MRTQIDHLKNLILDEKKKISFIKKLSEKNVKILLNRIKKDIQNVHKYSLANTIFSILSDIDSLEKSFTLSLENNNFNFITADLKKILKIFDDLFKKYNITIINDINVVFDPSMHQAISVSDLHNTKPNYIITVMQKGYKLHERILRPAMVVVSK
ncbi:Protein GrpE [Buchnera aphidicola (Takecallis arundicolens)]|uniref:nucleotide exchange factor GrpE n=1 Tax=Buchnera aphidicola TaxID=9 RepID=UPI003463A0CD